LYPRANGSCDISLGQVDLQRSLHEVEKKTEELKKSQRKLAEKEDEIEDYRAELEASEFEASRLKRSVDKLKEDLDNNRGDTQQISNQRDLLIKKLVEVEVDSEAAAQQANAFRDSVRKLERSRLISSARAGDLRQQRDLLVERLAEFETANKTLRKMLRQSLESERSALNVTQQRDKLIQQLVQSESTGQRLVDEVRDRDRQISLLSAQVDADKEQSQAYQELRQTMDKTRIRLRDQLVARETECHSLKSHVQSLEHRLSQEKAETTHLEQLLDETKGRLMKDKEALKRATKHQRERAARGEETIESLSTQLAQRVWKIIVYQLAICLFISLKYFWIR
jgi:chromosome segregation ATPase